jgi:hypothetical protein
MRKILFFFAFTILGCGGNGSVHSDADAQTAYLGLDASIDKAINLGFMGFNAASSANIPTEMTKDARMMGTLTVTGQVDQGASSNKTMRLNTAYSMYSDDGKVIYDTNPAALPMLQLDLMNIPTGTLSGSFAGAFTMSGNLKNTVTLTLAITANLMGTTGNLSRVAGSTHVTGTAVSDYGTYNVDVTR